MPDWQTLVVRSLLAFLVAFSLFATTCGNDGSAESVGVADTIRFPDVIDATASQTGDGSWTISATISSPYESDERFADAWRVLGPDGSVLGVRELLHDHAAEQPLTRSLSGVAIDDSIEEVTIEGRDRESGWGGETFSLALEPATN